MNGYRPPVPEGMPEGFRDLMIACWHEDPDQRPPFEVPHAGAYYHTISVYLLL